MKSKRLNNQTYPGRGSPLAKANGGNNNSPVFARFSHLVFDIDLTFGFWN